MQVQILAHVVLRIARVTTTNKLGTAWAWVIRDRKGREIDADRCVKHLEECEQTGHAAAAIAEECGGDVAKYWEAVIAGELAERCKGLRLRRRGV